MQELTEEQRTINEADVMYDSASEDDAGTGSWYDWITPAHFLRGGDGAELLAQWISLTPGCYYNHSDDGARQGASFQATKSDESENIFVMPSTPIRI